MTDTLAQNNEFWKAFYAKRDLRHTPSPFAQWCLEHYLPASSSILELGCGNGRDSFAFLHHNMPVIALDACDVAIADNIEYQRELNLDIQGDFLALDFSKLETLTTHSINTLYSRFVLHAIPEYLEDTIFDYATKTLPVGGRMLHEFRTIRDPLMQEGEALSETERLTTHYRRFLNPDVIREKLATRGWKELFFVESSELAVFGNENPVVARIVIEKQ
jgi:SAM-dependent methyltransferase